MGALTHTAYNQAIKKIVRVCKAALAPQEVAWYKGLVMVDLVVTTSNYHRSPISKQWVE